MITPRIPSSRSLLENWSAVLPVSPLGTFVIAVDVLFALLLAMVVLAAVCLLWKKKSPRQEFVLDLMSAESSADNNVEVFPEAKMHGRASRRAA